MIYVFRQLSESLSNWYSYQFAGQTVVLSEPIEALSQFSTNNTVTSCDLEISDFPSYKLLSDQNSDLHYQGKVQFNNQMSLVKYRRSSQFSQIDINGQPSCIVDVHNNCVVILNDYSFNDPFNIELISGPALILLLAQRSTFCLHAGAVSINLNNEEAANVAFIADSGVGKSTLSAEAGRSWQQLSDDILPVNVEQGIYVYNDFPQLKLPNAKTQEIRFKNNSLKFKTNSF